MFLFKAAISKKNNYLKEPEHTKCYMTSKLSNNNNNNKKTQYNKHTCSAPTKQEKLLCKSKHIKTCSSNKTPKEQI